jgi:7-cyano-7-deazaguanine synthase in queuosine biosynthesis
MKEILTLNSGGLDSLIAIRRLYERGYLQHSVFIDLGQPNRERAMESAKIIADKYCMSHEVIIVSSDSRNTFSTSNQINEGMNMKIRTPFTGAVTTTLAAVLCVCNNFEILSLGGYKPTKKGETPTAAGSRLAHLFNSTTVGERVKIIQPLDDIKRSKDLYALAESLGLSKNEMSETVSCNSAEPCRECLKCKQRLSAGVLPN